MKWTMLLLYKHSKELECNILFTFQIFNFFSRTAILAAIFGFTSANITNRLPANRTHR